MDSIVWFPTKINKQISYFLSQLVNISHYIMDIFVFYQNLYAFA